MNIKLKLIAAVLSTTVAVLGVTQIASAQNMSAQTVPGSAVSAPKVADTAEPGAGADTDQVQEGDQSGPETADAEAGEASEAAEPAGADTDNVQEGDQSGPDTPDAPGSASQ